MKIPVIENERASIKKMVRYKGYTITDVAKKLGTSQQNLNGRLNSASTLKTLYKLRAEIEGALSGGN